MEKKGVNLFQIAYLIVGGICAVEAVFALLRGNVFILLQGLVYILLSLFFVSLVSNEKLKNNTLEREAFADSLSAVFQKNELISIISKIDFGIAIVYVALRIYFDFGINAIIAKIPLFNLINALLASAVNILFYLFIIALVSMFAKKDFSKLVTAAAAFTAVSAVDLIFGLFTTIFKGYGQFAAVVSLMFFGYVVCMFYPHLISQFKSKI